MTSRRNLKDFLPMTPEEMRARGWDSLDVLLVTGDAYVDHPAFGAAVIGRVLEAEGYRVGIVAQPDWKTPEAFTALGRPRLFVGVTAGAMDSMVANFTANKKPRSEDAYAPGGAPYRRPDYATIVYTSAVRHALRGVPVVLGGIEASLRRFAHYDYWKNRVRRSILLDAKADCIVAGMGEIPVVEIARRLERGDDLAGVPGAVLALTNEAFEALRAKYEVECLASCEEVLESPSAFLDMQVQLEGILARDNPPVVAQRHGDRWVVQWPVASMQTENLDRVYALPFQRRAHPSYAEPIPALEPVRFSVASHRGCFGGCSFCALGLHQGRRIVSRSEDSIVGEIERFVRHPDFHGTVSDVGGPTANMYGMHCGDAEARSHCQRVSCVFPNVCVHLSASHARQVRLLRRALRIEGLKHLFIASGIRFDLIVDGEGDFRDASAREYASLLAKELVGGQLSAAPEHVAPEVLRRMRKPSIRIFDAFCRAFEQLGRNAGRELYVVPYFIASFPGCTDKDMESLQRYLEATGRRPQQIQDFLPGPMTLAAAMYYSGLDPRDKRPIYIAKTTTERRAQRNRLLYYQKAESPGPARDRAPHKGSSPRPKPTTSTSKRPKRRSGR
jgi:uncharacterized radical SAM protein YgiQ